MRSRAVSGIVLTFLLMGVLISTFDVEPVTTGTKAIVVRDEGPSTQPVENVTSQVEPEPTYVGVAKYYDDRKCAVTCSLDDLAFNATEWQNALSLLTRKKIYHTVAVITNSTPRPNDWNFMQYWLDQGYTEVGSHSRTHVSVPYTGTKISYEWQINGSRNDIIGNLTLPDWWRCDGREYVYAWIEPFGSWDNTVRQWLGDCHYLSDRSISSGVYDFAGWDSLNELFNRVGYTVEIGTPPWGGDSSVSSLNSKFNSAYVNGKIYHFIAHPAHVNWNEGAYADQHTAYISDRKNVWYVPFGVLYLYHWVDVRNIVNVTSSGAGQNKIFKLSLNEIDHLNYGVSYPITYVFDIPSGWTSGCVLYRYRDSEPWMLMENRSSNEYFNGVDASRFNLTSHRAYVSVGFSDVSHDIYIQLSRAHDVATTDVTPLKTVVGQGFSTYINVTIANQGDLAEIVDVVVYANSTVVDELEDVSLTNGTSTTLTFTWNTTGFAKGNYTISAYVTTVLGEIDTADNTSYDGDVMVTNLGDVNGDWIVNVFDLAIIGRAYGASPNQPRWNPNADMNNDQVIDVYDLALCGKYYGQTAP